MGRAQSIVGERAVMVRGGCCPLRWTGHVAIATVVLGLAACSSVDPAGTKKPAAVGDQPIVFSAAAPERPADLWVMNPDGSAVAQLTSTDVEETEPAWSPDGKRIVVVSADTENGDRDIEVIGADGSNRVRLTDTPATCETSPAWSPDGRSILFSRGPCDDDPAHQELASMTPRGEDVRTVVAAPASGASWSPDGSKFVYVGVNAAGDDTALWISRADGSGARRLALPGVNSPSEPSWAPDGALIAFVSPTGTLEGSPDTWNEDVFAVHPDGTGLEQLTTGRENDHWPPAWSPNGEALVYSTLDFEHQQDDLAWLDVATGDVEALTTTTGVEESNADWRR